VGQKLSYEEWRKKRKARVDAALEQARKRSQSTGHELSAWAVAMISTLVEIDPAYESEQATELSEIASAIDRDGIWQISEEWRISTCFDVSIVRKTENSKTWYWVKVECDGQILSCRSPSLERAFAFSNLYRRLIIDQFYSIGPAWADHPPFPPT